MAYYLMLLHGEISGKSEWHSMEYAFAKGGKAFRSILVITYFLIFSSNGT